MADHFINLSEEIKVPKEAADWFCSEHIDLKVRDGGIDDTLFTVERINDTTVWIHSEDHGNIDELSDLIFVMMRKFSLPGCIALEWADTCSKPEPASFGGGCAVATKDGVEWCTSNEFRYSHEKRVIDNEE